MAKGGLGARLAEVGLTAGQGIVWGNAMRLGLWNAVRKVWAPRGTAVSREVQIGRRYTYVAVALDPRTGQLWWAWQQNMKGAEMARIWGSWAEEPGIDGGVWEGVGGHKSADLQAIDAPQVVQPPYASELNPVERFLAYSRYTSVQ